MTLKISHIKTLYMYRQLQDIDIRFSDLMMDLAGDQANDDLYMASVLVNNITVYHKHICLDLEEVASKSITDLFPDLTDVQKKQFPDIETPSLDVWKKNLLATDVVGSPGATSPLILDNQNRLYLFRYWSYEKKLADLILNKICPDEKTGHLNLLETETLKERLIRYFPQNGHVSTDWQKIAALVAFSHRFCIISGGPGTGKTYTVTNILALLLEQDDSLKISICAPTGKAAAKLQDSIRKAKKGLKSSQTLKDLIPEESSTIHRLLGVRFGSPDFRHTKENPVPTDVLIVDEASMISLALLTKLLQAVSDKTRVIMLGDKNQLASVDAGSVFGDICESSDIQFFSHDFSHFYMSVTGEYLPESCITTSRFGDYSVELKHSYRFDDVSGIGKLSRLVNQGNVKESIQLLMKEDDSSVRYMSLPDRQHLITELTDIVNDKIKPVISSESVPEAFGLLDSFRILCSHRMSIYGFIHINLQIELILKNHHVISGYSEYYKGKPVMILKNDNSLKLYNGDIGIIWEDGQGHLKAFFPDAGGEFRMFSPSRLPEHETAFAMTIHKSQGSEFDEVLMILSDQDSPIFTRELIYTGITRARKKVTMWAGDNILSEALVKQVRRRSGLEMRLKRSLK